MPTAAEVAEFRAAQQGITTLVERDLAAFFASLDLAKPEAARDAMLEYVPELIRLYGLGAASVAADWYDEVRVTDGARGRFRAKPAEPVDVEVRTASTVRRAAAYLFVEGKSGLMLPAVTDPATKYALEPARDTIANAAVADPASRGWRRVTRPGSCDFCQTLSTRVYSHKTDHFDAHGHCLCVAAPVFD